MKLVNIKLLVCCVFISILLLLYNYYFNISSNIISADGNSGVVSNSDLFLGNKQERMEALERLSKSYWLIWSSDKLAQILLTDADADLRLKACNILSEELKNSILVPTFTYAVNDDNIFVRICAIRSLTDYITDYSIDTLINRLKIEDNDLFGINRESYEINHTSKHNVRREIIRAIRIITVNYKREILQRDIINVFKEHYETETDWGVKAEILESFLIFDRDLGINYLLKALGEEIDPYLLKFAENTLRSMHRGALADRVLAQRGVITNEVLIYEGNLQNFTESEKLKHIWENRNYYINMMLYDTNFAKRSYAVRELGKVANSDVIRLIERVLINDDNELVRRASVDSLGRCGDEASVKILIDAFYNEQNKNFQFEIVSALARLGVYKDEY